ncbi:MAG: hypothetical protein AAGC96_17945 [Pseudomonadota bacterium]
MKHELAHGKNFFLKKNKLANKTLAGGVFRVQFRAGDKKALTEHGPRISDALMLKKPKTVPAPVSFAQVKPVAGGAGNAGLHNAWNPVCAPSFAGDRSGSLSPVQS